jgi:cyanophycinase
VALTLRAAVRTLTAMSARHHAVNAFTFTLGITLTLAIAIAGPAAAQTASPPRVGPTHGSLVVVGGNLHDPAIYKRFIELAGGPDQLIVVIPTAGGARTYDQSYSGLQPWRAAGATNVRVLHTYDRAEADSDAFVEPLRRAHGVFFDGGRQWRLADAYLNTRTQRELDALLDRGGVIGGSSAGATIIGSFLVRGDTKTNETVIGDHLVGLGFLRRVAIDQHVLQRNRQFDLIDVVAAYPELLGIGIDENTAIVVQGDQLEVIGQSYALVYDPNRPDRATHPFTLLTAGDRYDLAARKATATVQRYGTGGGRAASAGRGVGAGAGRAGGDAPH